ncbi:MAG: porin family protein [Thiothrix sp.]|nr:MAG: porin family protein [Thiothrix sp.]
MNHSLSWRVLVLAGCLCCFQAVQADDDTPVTTPTPNYMGASLGTASSEFCTGLNHCGETNNTWKAYTGVRLNDKIFIEGSYVQFGEQQGIDANNNKASSSTKGYSTVGVVTYPLNNQIELFGKAGMWWWKNEHKKSTGTTATDGSDILLGAGANYNLGNNMGVRAEWERYQISQDSATKQPLDLLSVGVTFSSL